jgi:hypothetical protein
VTVGYVPNTLYIQSTASNRSLKYIKKSHKAYFAGITAVDASEVLDIMLSDYPHKYEEFRAHQRQQQLAAAEEDDKREKAEVKVEVKVEQKPEPPKVDPEKTRQVRICGMFMLVRKKLSKISVIA